MKNYETLSDALDDLRKRGYDSDFETQSFCLYCSDLDMRLDPEDFHVDEIYRFEEEFNSENSTVIYAISASSGVKGTLIDSYGSNPEDLNIKKKLQYNPAIEN